MVCILVVDDHDLILEGTVEVLHRQYADAKILTAKNIEEAELYVNSYYLDLDLVIMDLSLPEKTGMNSDIETGLDYLRKLLTFYPQLNILVQSSFIKVLTRLKHYIDAHEGGFCIADKGLPEKEMLKRANWAMQGITHTKDFNIGLELQPEWLDVLDLAFNQGLQNKAISHKMGVSERMVGNYWKKLQNALEIYPEEEKNLRILTLKRAREEGLID